MIKKYGSYKQLGDINAAPGGCGSIRKGCGFRGTLYIFLKSILKNYKKNRRLFANQIYTIPYKEKE